MLGDQYVRRLEIAVHQAVAMGGRQSPAGLRQQLRGPDRLQALFGLEQVLQGQAGNVFQFDKVVSADLADIVYGHDVRMHDRGGRPGLGDEQLQEILVPQTQVRTQDLDRARPLQGPVPARKTQAMPPWPTNSSIV